MWWNPPVIGDRRMVMPLPPVTVLLSLQETTASPRQLPQLTHRVSRRTARTASERRANARARQAQRVSPHPGHCAMATVSVSETEMPSGTAIAGPAVQQGVRRVPCAQPTRLLSLHEAAVGIALAGRLAQRCSHVPVFPFGSPVVDKTGCRLRYARVALSSRKTTGREAALRYSPAASPV